MADERRAYPRARGVLECTWAGGLKRCSGLSISGCFVETMGLPQLGSKVRIELHLPDQGSVSVDGEVLRTDEVAMGFSMRFVDLTPETRAKLARAVDAVLQARGIP
jgi:hypothetical protein